MVETKPAERPLSPHLQIYRWPVTMTVSILHRITGGALYFGTLLVLWWLLAAAVSDSAFDMARSVFGHWFGELVLFGYSWALIHHALGGIRHLVWDLIYGFEPAEREMLALASIIGSIVLTVVVWVVGYLAMGGPR